MNLTTSAAEVLRPIEVEDFGALNPQLREALATAALFATFFDETPGETGSRVITAHHEAGHVVVAKALGYSIDSVLVELDPALCVWVGWTEHHVPGEPSGVCIPAKEPDVAERMATVELAGFIAEGRITQPLHPKSSMDERFRAAIACAALDDAAGCAAGTTLTRVIDRVCTIIGCNVAAFDAMVGLLLRETRPDLRQLTAALASIEVSCDFTREEGV